MKNFTIVFLILIFLFKLFKLHRNIHQFEQNNDDKIIKLK